MKYEPCDCNGMSFICNRWVYTGDCEHRREQRVQEELKRLKAAGETRRKEYEEE